MERERLKEVGNREGETRKRRRKGRGRRRKRNGKEEGEGAIGRYGREKGIEKWEKGGKGKR